MLTRTRASIEQLLAVVATAMSCGSPLRKQVRDDLAAAERHLRQSVASLRKATVTPLGPAILGRLAWKECRWLEAAVKAYPEYLDRDWWPPSITSETFAALLQDLEYIANNIAHQISCIPPRGGRNSITDVRAPPGADLLCAAAAIEAIYRLRGTRPERFNRILGVVCQAFWKTAGGDAAKVPNWKHLVRRVLRAASGSRAELAVALARAAGATILDPQAVKEMSQF